MTLEDVRDKLSGCFKRIREQIANHKDWLIADKTGMAAYSKQYKRVYGKCGKYGHHRMNCQQNKKNGFKFQVGNDKSGACYS